jgi:peptide/nickel transport system substrate-binding protein
MTQKHSLNRRAFIGSAAASGAAAASATWSSDAQAQAGNTLRVRSYTAPEVLDPAFQLGATDADVSDATMPGLVRLKGGTTWDWELDAATSIEQVDVRHIKFELRRGLGWTNGFGDVTAEDVKFSYERIANPNMKSPYQGDWKALDRVELTSSHTGTIILKEPYPPLFSSTLPQSSGAIVCKKAVEKLEGQRFGLEPPATFGPYKIARIEPRVRITLDRWSGWTGPRPDYDEVLFIAVLDANAAETAFQAGELDVALVPMTAVPRLKKAMPPRSKLNVAPSLAYWWIGMQMEDGVFADKRVRQAMQYAIDVQSVLDGAFFGVAERATGIIAGGMIGHRPRNKIDKPDLAKARALLAEAGHGRGFKTQIGVRNSAEFINAAQVVAASLAQIGVTAEIVPYDTGVQKATAGKDWKTKQAGMHIARFSMRPDPSWATVWFTKAQIGEWNWERFADDEYNRLHDEALREIDPAKRNVTYMRMQDIMEESGAYIFMTHGVNAILHRDHFIPGLSADNNRVLVTRFKKV